MNGKVRHWYHKKECPLASALMRFKVTMEIIDEVERGNEKHGHGPIATPKQVALILIEELGEYTQAVMQKKPQAEIRKELLQICAVAFNALTGAGPHYSDRA